jgi:hypothetical protein
LKTKPLMEYVLELNNDEKGQVIKELSALLLTIPVSRKTARLYIQHAIDYIEKH